MTSDTQAGRPSAITLAFSCLTHLLLLLPTIYLLTLAFQTYSFFAWHPICMTLGVGLLITEAVFCISGEVYIGTKLSRQNRVTMHWVLHTVGLGLLMIGLIIIVVNKIDHNRKHFATPHAILGLISIILVILVAGFGIVTNNTRWVYPQARPIVLKIFHAFGGVAITILLLSTLITGLYTGWWSGTDAGRNVVLTSFCIAGFFILLKPILGAISRSKVAFRPSSSTS